MVRTLGLATFGAFRMCGGREGMMRPAHIAARRRGLSFGHRHGGKLLQRPGERFGAKQGAWVAGKPCPIQAKSRANLPIKVRISTL